MKKQIFIIIIICIILLGCKAKTPTTHPTYINYKTGTDGLDVNFIKGQPPDEIWENSEILVGVEIQNKGAYNVERGLLKLTYDKGYFEMYELPESIKPLEGKGQFYPEGERYIESFTGKNIKEIPIGKDDYAALFKIRTCYPYATEASTDICLNPSEYDYLNLNKESCKSNRVFTLSSQGAPLAVTRIEETIIPIDEIDYKVQFIIDIVNKGKGDVRSLDAYQKECTGTEYLNEETEVGVFEIGEISFSDFSTLASGEQNIDCGPYDRIKLEDNKAQITCSAVIEKSRGIFQTPLKINLGYGYTIEKQKTTKIKKIKYLK
jgi:hypothetical protein